MREMDIVKIMKRMEDEEEEIEFDDGEVIYEVGKVVF
jgi:tetrahydromethanopterin S-methyltransferase subunit G